MTLVVWMRFHSSSVKSVMGFRTTAGVLAPSDAVRAAWLFLLSLTVQGAAVALTPQYSGDQVIFGAPVAEAFIWHRLGVEIAHGNGVETPLRPLYPIVLALFFQGLGYGLGVAKAVNVLLASLTVSLSYLVFRFAAPQGAATILALALAARPDFVLFSHSLLTEHAGLCFSMASLLALLLGMAGRRPTWWWTVSGLTMGLSTLARPLALFAVPLALVAGSLRLGRRAGLPFFCFLAALGLAPTQIGAEQGCREQTAGQTEQHQQQQAQLAVVALEKGNDQGVFLPLRKRSGPVVN